MTQVNILSALSDALAIVIERQNAFACKNSTLYSKLARIKTALDATYQAELIALEAEPKAEPFELIRVEPSADNESLSDVVVIANTTFAIETLIDTLGVDGLLEAMAEICIEKAEHIGSNYGDLSLAAHWRGKGIRLEKQAAKF